MKFLLISSKAIIISSFIFCTILGVDLALPLSKSTERVISYQLESKSRGKYSNKVSYSHTIKVITEHHAFPTHVNHRKNIIHGPTIELEHSPLFGIVTKGYIPSSKITVNAIENFRGNVWFMGFIAVTSFIGFFFFKNKEQTINFGVVCFILMLIQFYLLRWF